MKLLKCVVILVSVYFCLISCTSPEKRWAKSPITDSATLDSITTCRHGSLDVVKKNLILMGYEVEESDDQILSTNYKQDRRNFDGSQIYKKINVIKTGPDSIKFKVIERKAYQTREADDQYYVGVNGGSYANPAFGSLQATSYKNVTKTDEYDPIYYNGKIDSYKLFRDQVCGR